MSSRIAGIRDAVNEMLGNATYSVSGVSFSTTYKPRIVLGEMPDNTAKVFVRAEIDSGPDRLRIPGDRGGDRLVLPLQIIVAMKLPTSETGEVDKALALAEEVQDETRRKTNSTPGGLATFLFTDIDPVADPNLLEEEAIAMFNLSAFYFYKVQRPA